MPFTWSNATLFSLDNIVGVYHCERLKVMWIWWKRFGKKHCQWGGCPLTMFQRLLSRDCRGGNKVYTISKTQTESEQCKRLIKASSGAHQQMNPTVIDCTTCLVCMKVSGSFHFDIIGLYA